MQSDRHAALIARDLRNSKALFAQSWRRVDFSRSRPERSSASVDFAEDRIGRWRPRNAAGICSLGLLRICRSRRIIAKAREFDAKVVVTDPDDSSYPTDDAM